MDNIAIDNIETDNIAIHNIATHNIADNATLAFFTNPAYLSIIQRKMVKTPAEDNNNEAIKFYKKRMISLFKDIFKEDNMSSLGDTKSSLGGETPTPTPGELKEAHHRFALLAVKYFETIDKKDIIQEQHAASAAGASATGASATGASATGMEADMAEIDTSNIFTVDDANNVMMRKTITYANLDNYVIMKEDLSANDLRIIPMKIDINLKTPDLKIKGLKPKIKKSKNTKEDLSQQIIVDATPQSPNQAGKNNEEI
jgi:hypothetical protein